MSTDQKTSFSVEDQYKMPFFNAEAQPSPPAGVKVTEAKKNNTAESNRIYYVCTRKWSRGRAVRQRSAKPCTAVRICSRPQRKAPSSTNVEAGVFLFYGHASLSTNMVGSLANGHIKEKLPDKPQA